MHPISTNAKASQHSHEADLLMQADKLIRELQSSNRLLKSELQATTTSFKQALHAAQTMLDTGQAVCISAVCASKSYFVLILLAAMLRSSLSMLVSTH